MVSTIMGILLIPVFLLFQVPISYPRIALTSIAFIFLFAIIITIMAKARIYDIIASTVPDVSRGLLEVQY